MQKAKFLRYIVWGLVAVFVITVTIVALVEGFGSGQQGFAFLGIACFLFSLTTFFMQFKIVKGDLPDAARFPVYLQLAFVVFFGIAILLTVYSNWHPAALDWFVNISNEYKYALKFPPWTSSPKYMVNESA